jgi:hypothetical protein
MLRRFALLLGLALCWSASAGAQDKVEAFGGYSFMHYGTNPSFNTNGWEISGQYKLIPWLGVIGDIDGHYGTLQGVGSTLHNYLVGAQFSFPARVSPFAHVLIGDGRFSGGGISSSSIAEGFGFGVDDHLAPLVSWRMIQIDVIHTHLFNAGQSNTRVSTGIVFHF